MGNLLGAPVTEKETHTGQCLGDNGQDVLLDFGVSSMQGWRVHMEDAHIAESKLYAINTSDGSSLALPGHALFAVFDGHGGTFAAKYSGDNLCRVLSKQPLFWQYAKFHQERATKEWKDDNDDSSSTSSKTEKARYLRQGLDLLEEALKHAFVELDQEIAFSIRGTSHPDSNQPYHHTPTTDHHTTTTTTTSSSTNNEPKDATMSDVMAAAQQVATHQANALDDEGDSGTTACCVLITPDWLVCANAGDSRAVYCRSKLAVPLSYDHKPDDEEEERRIRAAGGYVAGGRVEGDLAVSRGLGDFRFKHLPTVLAGKREDVSNKKEDGSSNTTTTTTTTLIDGQVDSNSSSNGNPQNMTGLMNPGDQKVSPIPDIIVQTRNPETDEFVIVACDGIWDVRTNQECVQDVMDIFQEGESHMGLVCEEIVDMGLRLGSKDNMTALVVKLPSQTIGEGGGVMARRAAYEAQLKEHTEQEDSAATTSSNNSSGVEETTSEEETKTDSSDDDEC